MHPNPQRNSHQISEASDLSEGPGEQTKREVDSSEERANILKPEYLVKLFRSVPS